MSKLDEIDAEAGSCQDNGDADYWMKDYAALLIRAVRQLGAIVLDEYGSLLEAKTELDPDVLELIGGEE